MRKGLRTPLVAGACLTVTAAVGAVTAYATSAPAESTWMVCPDGGPVRQGHLDTFTLVGSSGPAGVFDVTGAITPCHPSTKRPGPGFALAAYSADAAGTVDGGFRRYDELGAGGTFAMRVTIVPGTRAACLISAADTRLDCFRLTWPAAGTPVVGDRVPTDSPEVGMTAVLHNYRHDKPGCSTCLQQ